MLIQMIHGIENFDSGSIESMAGQPALFKLYREYQENPSEWKSFWHGCLDLLNLILNIIEDR